MTGIDFITLILILSSILVGYYRGFVGSTGDIIGITAGIIISSFAYKGPLKLLKQFEITGIVVELVCFLLTVLFFILLLILLIESLKKRIDIKHIVDRIAGLIPGFFEGCIFCSMLFTIMSASFNSAMDVQKSKLPKRIIRFMPDIYQKTERAGITIPKMIFLPSDYLREFDPTNKEIQFLSTNFYTFEGFTCMECGGKVRFEGYFPRVGASFIPKFICTNCGRISDGCQTFEGFHKLYNKCPIDITREKKMRFDCGHWPNHRLISPKGTCPIDNKVLELWLWEPPQKY